MKTISLLLILLSISVQTIIAQFKPFSDQITEAKFNDLKKVRDALLQDKDLVFHLPINDKKDWAKDLIDDLAVKGAVFSSDRYLAKNESKVFNSGVEALQVKPGIYFNGDFTISVWVNVSSVSKWSRIIDFGLGQNNSNVVFSNSASLSGIPGLAIYKGKGTDLTQLRGKESDRLKEGEWYHLAASLSGDIAKLYINGNEIASATGFYKPQPINRKICYIGKSNFENESNFYGYMDDLRIYSRALNIDEIKLLADVVFTNKANPKETISINANK